MVLSRPVLTIWAQDSLEDMLKRALMGDTGKNNKQKVKDALISFCVLVMMGDL